jgi:hypothetical protein
MSHYQLLRHAAVTGPNLLAFSCSTQSLLQQAAFIVADSIDTQIVAVLFQRRTETKGKEATCGSEVKIVIFRQDNEG